jgi:ketosteroid isomerase-like protein
VNDRNVELAREATLAWNDGGADALVEYLETDVVWNPPAESMEPGVYRGHDGVRDYLGRLGEIFEERRVEPLDVIEVDGQRVIAVVRIIGRSEKFGMEIDADWAWLIEVGPNGLGGRVDMFTSREQALQAAGVQQ